MIGRKFTGEIAKIFSDKTISDTDDITTRILWLSGLEEGLNKGKNIDSFKRYIYIHGTSEEGRLGIPSSHGCIRMKNKDVIDLYKESRSWYIGAHFINKKIMEYIILILLIILIIISVVNFKTSKNKHENNDKENLEMLKSEIIKKEEKIKNLEEDIKILDAK